MNTEKTPLKCDREQCKFHLLFTDPNYVFDDSSCIVNAGHKAYTQKGIENAFKFVNSIILGGAGIALVILVSKFYGIKTIGWNDINIPMKHAWLIFLALTVAHGYFGWQLFSALKKVGGLRCDQQRLDIYRAITSSDSLFISGLNPTPIKVVPTMKMTFAQFDKKDPTYWFRLGVLILVFVAMLDLREISFANIMTSISVAYLNVIFLSYYLGSFYDLAFSGEDRDLNLLDHIYY